VQNNKVSIKNFITPGIPLAILLVMSCFALWVITYFGGHFVTVSMQNNSVVVFLQSILIPNTILSGLTAISFTLLNAFLVAQLNNRFTLIRSRTFLPIFIFVLLLGVWNETHLVNGSHLALTIFIIALFFTFNMFHNRNASEEAFMGSFLISVSSLFINPLIFLIPVFWIGFIMLQSFSLRTLIASLLGTVTPWILTFSGQYLIYSKIDFASVFSIQMNLDFNLYTFTLVNSIYIASMAIILIICLAGMFSNYSRDAIHTRNKLNFIFLLLIAILILSIIFENQFSSFLPIIALLFSFLISHPFTLKQNNFFSIVFIIFCVLNISFVLIKFINI